MTAFTVQSAEFVKTLPPKDGRKPMYVHRLSLLQEGASPDGSPQQQTVPCEWLTTQEQPPAPGTTLEGDLEQGQYGLKFKKAQQAFGGGGSRKTDPADAARMLRCHSQSVGVELARLLIETGRIEPKDFDRDVYRKLVDWLDQDVKGAARAVSS